METYRHAELRGHGDRHLMLQGVKASGVVKGRVLVMTLQQLYRNTGQRNIEITYSVPLPQQAVLMEVEVELNGKKLTGEVAPRRMAREKYEEALSKGNSSIMLEKNHDGSYTLELGNLMAGEECLITVRYAQVLPTEHGQVRLMLPTTIAPRCGNPITQGKLAPHQVPVTSLFAEYPFDITLTLTGDMASANVASPSHKTSYSRVGDTLVISLAQQGRLDRDFILVISDLKNNSDALASPDLADPGQYALMASFSPKLPTATPSGGTITAKVLVDCSSSMAGDSIMAAKRALQGIVDGLTEADRISLSRFGNTVEHRSRSLWRGTRQVKASASRWVENLQADLGGTEMNAALLSTIALAEGQQSDILLITDGQISGIDEVLETAIESQHRVFVVAIGASPAEVHLRRLATETGGHCDFVAPGEAVEPAVLRMSARMRSARAPQITIEWPKGLTLRWQQRLPSVIFEDDDINVCAFADAPAHDTTQEVRLWGSLEGNSEKLLLATAPLIVTESSTNVLARLVAQARYEELSKARAKVGAPSLLSVTQDLAVKYRLVTDETNFVLVHERTESEKAQEMPDGHVVPQMMAAGWGGTGSVVYRASSFDDTDDDLSFNAPNTMQSRRVSDESMDTPSVWRNRTSSAALDRYSSSSGLDDFEIPAFLRKQIDSTPTPSIGARFRLGISKLHAKSKPSSGSLPLNGVGETDFNGQGITPLGLQRWLSVNPESLWPKTYAGLQTLGLSQSICEWLEFEGGDGKPEAEVVRTFLQLVCGLALTTATGLKNVLPVGRNQAQVSAVRKTDAGLMSRLQEGLKGMTVQKWATRVASFPE